jgi:uncharacterized protein YeaO (DUF488 family)
MTGAGHIEVSHIDQPRSQDGGLRILVDRGWPRDTNEASADIDIWCDDSAPSLMLDTWYLDDLTRFAEFRERYLTELDDAMHAEPVAFLHALAGERRLTLLTAAGDLARSHARVLAERLSWGHATEEPTIFYIHINNGSNRVNRRR